MEDRLIRSCRSGSNWKEAVLREYNIISKLERDEIEFFGESKDDDDLSELPSGILECEEPNRLMTNKVYQFLKRLKMAYRTRKGEEVL